MKPSNTEVVMEAISDLFSREQIVTRETLSELTGLKMTIIDDRLSYLVDSGQIYRVQRGVFMPAVQHEPSRIMSKTVLPDGTVKIDIGDDHTLTLTPREARVLGDLTAAAGMEYVAIELGHQSAILAGELSLQLKAAKKAIAVQSKTIELHIKEVKQALTSIRAGSPATAAERKRLERLRASRDNQVKNQQDKNGVTPLCRCDKTIDAFDQEA